MNNDEIKELFNIINSYFADGDIKEQLTNFKKFLSYVDNRLLSFENAYELIQNDKVSKMIEVISNSKYNKRFLKYDNYYILANIYCDLHNIPFENNELYYDEVPSKEEDSLNYYFRDIDFTRLLTIEEEKELCKRVSNGDQEAKRILVESNLRLAYRLAKHYKDTRVDLDLMDLIQNANMGLMKAVDKFDFTKGVKFSTYAFYWIKNSILKNMDKDIRLITIPNYLNIIYRKVMRFVFNYEETFGVKPTDEIIAEELELPLNKVKIVKSIMNPVSLNQPYSTSEDGKEEEDYINIIPDSRDDYEGIIDKMFLSQLMPLIEKQHLLCDVELFIIKCRFGFGCEPMTYRQIGEVLGVTHENVRQREGKALRKLGRSSIFRKYCGLDSIDDFIFNSDKCARSLRLYYSKKGR